MNENYSNVLAEKSYQFALKVVLIYIEKEFVLSKQLLRSGTSIGANIEEAIGGFSKKDFTAKLGISYKESRETKYWLRLLKDSEYLNDEDFNVLYSDCDELSKILFSTIRSSRSN